MPYNGQEFEYEGEIYKYIDPFSVKRAKKGTSNWYHFSSAIHIEDQAMKVGGFWREIAKGLGLQYERKE